MKRALIYALAIVALVATVALATDTPTPTPTPTPPMPATFSPTPTRTPMPIWQDGVPSAPYSQFLTAQNTAPVALESRYVVGAGWFQEAGLSSLVGITFDWTRAGSVSGSDDAFQVFISDGNPLIFDSNVSFIASATTASVGFGIGGDGVAFFPAPIQCQPCGVRVVKINLGSPPVEVPAAAYTLWYQK
jgi:hypothetical protein